MGRKTKRLLSSFLAFALVTGLLAGIQSPSAEAAAGLPAYLDPGKSVEERAADLLSRMTVEEKAGQMIQPERATITPQEVKQYYIGSVLSGGGSFPNGRQSDSTPEKWRELTDSYQDGALSTRLGIPLLYGVDAVHGHNNVIGATLFPHNIGLGAANNPELTEEIGAAVAKEMRATGANWDFAPTIAAPQDIRWGRTYEGYSSNPARSGSLGAAFIEGLQGKKNGQWLTPENAVGTAKHFIGEGFTDNGKNQGDITKYTEEQILAHDLQMYEAAVDAGVQTVMASYHSIAGLKMHANKRLLTDVLKGELGFEGFVISDYNAIQQITKDHEGNAVSGLKNQLRVSVNAGVDMFMLTGEWKNALNHLIALVGEGAMTEERLNDAVLRILKVKIAAGLFEHPKADSDLAMDADRVVGAPKHRAVARQAVAESLVLLKNDEVNGEPIMSQLPDMDRIFVAGRSADDIGIQSGGWSITWQGASGDITDGTTILEGIREAAGSSKTVTYNKHGRGAAGYDVAIAVVGETPYAESNGDKTALGLEEVDIETIRNIRAADPDIPIVVVLVSGRPMTIGEHLDDWQGLVAAWLPGTEGRGVADVLLGAKDFKGTNPIEWPFYVNAHYPLTEDSDNLLFDVGYGLTRDKATPALPSAPPLPQPDAEDIPGKIEAEAFTAKSSGLNTETTSDTDGGLNVGWTSAGAWLDYTVNVAEPGTYKAEFRYAGNGGATGIRVKTESGATLGTLNVGSTGGWQSWTTAEAPGIVLKQEGVQTLRLEFIAGDINLNWFSFTRTGDVPADNGGGGTDPVGGGEGTGAIIAEDAVQAWMTNERDPGDRKWYYSDRSQPGDKKLEQGPALDLRLPDGSAMTTITLDPDKTYQSMLGIGTSMEEATVHNLVKMSDAKQEELLRKLFDPETGIGISMVRLTIGTSDFTAEPFYSYNDLPPGETDEDLSEFTIEKDFENGIIDTVKKIQAINPDVKFFASPWSPPGWMKTTGSMVRGQVKEEYLPLVAKYYVKFLEAYAAEGIYFDAMTLQNEPLLEIDYPSTAMSWQQTSRLAKLLRAELDANSNGLIKSVKLWMFDHNPGDTMAFPAPLLGDELEGAYDAVEGTAFHDYGGELSEMSRLHDMFPEKSVYLTERAVWGTTGADRIAQYFRNYARSYNNWVTMLDSDIATHQWVGIPDPTPVIQDSSDPNNYWFLPEYYLMGHYTKFVKPGYVRIDSNYGSSSTVTNVAFKSPDGKEIVTVVVNRTNDPQPFKIMIDGLQTNATLPAKSVATYVFDRTQTLKPGTAVDASAFVSADGAFASPSDGSIGGFPSDSHAAFDYLTESESGGSYYVDIEYAGAPENGEIVLAAGDAEQDVIALTEAATGQSAKVRGIVNLAAGKQLLTMKAKGAGYSIVRLTLAPTEAAAVPGLLGASSYTDAYGVLTQGTSIVNADSGDWVQYEVNAPASGSYGITYQYAAPSEGANIGLSVNDGEPVSVALPGTGGPETAGSVSESITLNQGANTIHLSVTDSVYRLDPIAIGETIVTEQGVIAEGSENGSEVTVRLLNGTFAAELNAANWSVSGLSGVSVAGVERVGDTTAQITFAGPAMEDYDVNRSVLLTAASAEVSGAVTGTTLAGGVTFAAVDDQEAVALSETQASYPVDGKELILSIVGGRLLADHVSGIYVSGSAVTQGGVTLASAEALGDGTVKLKLAWNGTTYYDDLLLQVHVPVTAYGDSTGGSELTASATLAGTANVTDAVKLLGLNALDQFNRMKGLTVTGTGSASRFTSISAGDYADYKVDVPDAGTYIAELTVTSNSQAYNGIVWQTKGNSVKTTVTVPNLYNQVVRMRAKLELDQGEQLIRLSAGAGGYELRGIRFEKLETQVMDEESLSIKVEAESFAQASSGAVQTNNAGTANEFRNVGFTVAGGTLDYAVDVAKSGYYKVVYRYATPQSGVRLTMGGEAGESYGSVVLGSTGDWGAYQEAIGIVQLEEGEQTLRLTFAGDGGNLDWFTLEETEPAAVIGGLTALPSASLKAGAYAGSRSVTLSTATDGADIYYTLDGSLPSRDNGTKYTGAISLDGLTVIRAIVVKEGMQDSFVAPFTYRITPGPVTPPGVVITPPGPEKPVVDGTVIKAPAPKVDANTGIGKTAIDKAALDEALEGGASNAVQRITINVPQAAGANGYEIAFPAESLATSELEYLFAVETDSGTIQLPSHMLDAAGTAKTVSIVIRWAESASLGEELQTEIEYRSIIELHLLIDGVQVEWSNSGAKVQAAIPYQPSASEQENSELLTVWYIGGEGKAVSVPSGRYDKSLEAVTFETNHFSSFAIVYVEKSFDDLARYGWAKHEIEVMAAKGIIYGVSDNKYAPERQVKRADFLLLLARALGWEAQASDSPNRGGFTDVAEGDYYYDAVIAAKSLGIVTGRTDGSFDPDASITRQEMMAMTARALAASDKSLEDADRDLLQGFSDLEKLADYAEDSAALLLANGIVQGSAGKLNPLGSTTRAEAALIVYRIYNM